MACKNCNKNKNNTNVVRPVPTPRVEEVVIEQNETPVVVTQVVTPQPQPASPKFQSPKVLPPLKS